MVGHINGCRHRKFQNTLLYLHNAYGHPNVKCVLHVVRNFSQVSCLDVACAGVYPYADTRITYHVFILNRNKLVLKMQMSTCFKCDEGDLQTEHVVASQFGLEVHLQIDEEVVDCV